MVEIKANFSGGLDYDTSHFYVPKNAYVDALNITRDSFARGADQIITNVLGNRVVANSLHAGTNVCIGAYPFPLRNTVIYFVWNSTNYHTVYEYNNTTRTVAKVFQNLTDSGGEDIIDFTQYGIITGVNIFPRTTDEGDLLYFLDSGGRPICMNITRFKNGEYTPITADILYVGKRPPLSPPSCVYDNDTSRTTNNLRNRLFRFKYRWVYDDFEKSTTSPISAVPLPADILDDEFTSVQTNNNLITVQLNSGPKNVSSVELLVSIAERVNVWSDFAVVETINKATESLDDNVDFGFSFYNDGTYPTLDINESNLLFDYVPDYAKSQEMPNGNVLVYGAITEGYNRTLTPNVTLTVNTVAAGDGSVIGTLNAVHSTFLLNDILTFSGVPGVGTVINVYALNPGQILIGTYTTVLGDTASSVAAALATSMDNLGITTFASSSGAVLTFTLVGETYESVEITAPSTSATTSSIPTWMWSTDRRIGIVYFDQTGKTNGVLYSAAVQFPDYAENGSQQVLLPYINAKIYHTPPDWAYSYQWVITKEGTQYLFTETVDVNTTESDFIYFQITLDLNAEKTPTVASVVNWTFQEGDRVRLIRRMGDNTVYNDTYDAPIEGIVVDPQINGVTQTGKTFVKIKNFAPFSAVNYSTDFFVIQLYRPEQPAPSGTNEVYYEFGEQYAILNPTTIYRQHAGEVTNQNSGSNIPAEFNFYEGDSYFRVRTVYLSQSGLGTFNVQDRNFVDFYISAVNSLEGRPHVIDINAKESYYSALIRFGQAYQPNTNINALNRFYPADFTEVDYSFGDIMRFMVRDRYMRVYQKFKCGVIPLFNQISRNADGTSLNVVTSQLLNPIQYYAGDWGIFTAPESLASFNFADYFCDTNKGVVCRVSQDGVTPISVLYKMNSWATAELPLRIGNYKIFGAYNQRTNQYIAALTATDTSDAQTITFSEETNNFESFLSAHPEMMCTLGNLLISWKDGALWTHDSDTYNQFFGVDYESNIKFVFNENPVLKKQPLSITETSNVVWDCPEIITQVNSYGAVSQQSSLVTQEFLSQEGQFNVAIRRDANSVGGRINGNFMKGIWTTVKFRRQNASDLITLNMVTLKYIQSPLNNS